MNIYFDHFIDKPWRLRHPEIPLIRCVDDLLILAETAASAEECLADLRDLLEPTELSLKDPGRGEPSATWARAGDVARILDPEGAAAPGGESSRPVV